MAHESTDEDQAEKSVNEENGITREADKFPGSARDIKCSSSSLSRFEERNENDLLNQEICKLMETTCRKVNTHRNVDSCYIRKENKAMHIYGATHIFFKRGRNRITL